MNGLADFLLARIAEDEEAARAATSGPWMVAGAGDHVTVTTPDGSPVLDAWAEWAEDWGLSADEADLAHITRHDPARVLAECDAKRRIVETHPIYPDGDQHDCPGRWPGYQDAPNEPCPTLRLLALPYADHPDYRQEWAP